AHAGVVAAVEHAEAQVHAALAGHQPHRDVEQSERERACPDGPGHAVVSARSARLLRRDAAFGPGFVVAAGGPAAARHPDPVLDRVVAGHGRGDVLRAMPHPAPGDLALQHHLAILAAHLDAARIIRQVFADLFEDPRIRALVAARAMPAVLAIGFMREITEPAAVLLAGVPAAPARAPCRWRVAFRRIIARQVRVRLPVHALDAPGAVLARIAPAQRAVPPMTATLVPVGGISIAMSSHVCLLRAGRLLRSGADVAAAVDVDD